ncbi:hypothetical protein CCHR01_18626 [Colletotrichum chrysophilum]|uniref:Uncharacterized protein n=1 Tax=Colletotrichum chrysophilum TaxID=1836956 RepID=A0AAD9A055_9PEZI|nr:hypothetical protein CCHR01_18626 [Colletotrichum chrysophilum]
MSHRTAGFNFMGMSSIDEKDALLSAEQVKRGYGRDRSISGGGHRVGEPGMVFGGDPGRPGADPKRGLAAEAGIHGRYLQSR